MVRDLSYRHGSTTNKSTYISRKLITKMVTVNRILTDPGRGTAPKIYKGKKL